MIDTYIKLVQTKDEIKVDYEGVDDDLIKMIIRVAEHDIYFREIIMAAAMTIDYLEGMDDIEEEINNL